MLRLSTLTKPPIRISLLSECLFWQIVSLAPRVSLQSVSLARVSLLAESACCPQNAPFAFEDRQETEINSHLKSKGCLSESACCPQSIPFRVSLYRSLPVAHKVPLLAFENRHETEINSQLKSKYRLNNADPRPIKSGIEGSPTIGGGLPYFI